MSDYLLLETGDRIILEDASGFLLLESGAGFPWFATVTDAARFSGTLRDTPRFGASATDAGRDEGTVEDA